MGGLSDRRTDQHGRRGAHDQHGQGKNRRDGYKPSSLYCPCWLVVREEGARCGNSPMTLSFPLRIGLAAAGLSALSIPGSGLRALSAWIVGSDSASLEDDHYPSAQRTSSSKRRGTCCSATAPGTTPPTAAPYIRKRVGWRRFSTPTIPTSRRSVPARES